jgi:hypothetical protein
VHTLDEVLGQVRESGTTVYAIGLGPRVDKDGLTKVAEVSGGAAYFPEDVTQLADRYRRVVDDLRRRYLVTYTSTNSTRDGAWRNVEITTGRADMVIRSAGGYTAPGRARPAAQQEHEED